MATDKINEATAVASSRSRCGNKKEVKTKQQLGTAQEKLFTKKIKRLFNMLEDNNASSTIARPNKLN
jgi:hypothetical protein